MPYLPSADQIFYTGFNYNPWQHDSIHIQLKDIGCDWKICGVEVKKQTNDS